MGFAIARQDYRAPSETSRVVVGAPVRWHAMAMRPALAPYPPSIRRAALVIGLCLAAVIGYFSLVTPGEAPAPQISDKLRHFAAYAALAIPAAMWLGPGHVGRGLLAVVVVALYGAGLEAAQSFSGTGREGSVADGAANALGAMAGVSIVFIIARTRRG